MADERTFTLHNGASEEYREMAAELRRLAQLSRFPGSRRDLLELAARLERKAEHFDSRDPDQVAIVAI